MVPALSDTTQAVLCWSQNSGTGYLDHSESVHQWYPPVRLTHSVALVSGVDAVLQALQERPDYVCPRRGGQQIEGPSLIQTDR